MLHPLLFRLVEPVGKTVVILITQLGIELLIIQIPGPRVVDVLHSETEPSTVTGVISQETILITRGTKRCQTVLGHDKLIVRPSDLEHDLGR